jgi:hypothetical protein
MERVDTSRPLWIPVSWTTFTEEEQATYKEVVMTCLERLAKYEFFMRNVQIYVQPDKSLVMLDFGDIHCVPGGPLLQSHRIFPPSVMKSMIAK